MKALVIVDLQNDFLPGGALPAANGNKIIPVVNRLINYFDLIVASKDWHPKQTVHFNKWPIHCIQDSHGAEFPPDFKSERVSQLVLKGTNDVDDGYSAFEGTNIDLGKYFKEKNIQEIYVCGLTTEYCVKNTVLDAIRLGFKTNLVKESVAAVQAHPDDEEQAWQEMIDAGAFVFSLNDFLESNPITAKK